MAKVAAGALLGSITLMGCPNPTNPPEKPQPKECMCPDKIHGNTPCDCGAIDCTCEQKEWALSYNLTLVNETGDKIGDIKGIVEAGLDRINDYYPTTMTDVAALNAKIVITSNSEDWDRNGNSVTIGKQALGEQTASLLAMTFRGMTKLPDPNAISMTKFNSSIRKAKAARLWNQQPRLSNPFGLPSSPANW
ncbi:MAG: hypothetical protein LBH70_08275 [Spirochaetaceae bacterium]|jgi:hypothetical protein|nr:hypothetical protein [Spirochaetaceae bacterium]